MRGMGGFLGRFQGASHSSWHDILLLQAGLHINISCQEAPLVLEIAQENRPSPAYRAAFFTKFTHSIAKFQFFMYLIIGK